MVLDEKLAVKTERLGLHIVLDEITEARATVDVRTPSLRLGTTK